MRPHKRRMLYLYRGWNSGTNEAVLNAWRTGSPEIEISAYDVEARALGDIRAKLSALPTALRRGGPKALIPGKGRYADAVKRSGWHMARIAGEVDKLQAAHDSDFSLTIGTVTPNLNPKQPHFVYTDLTMKANVYYPEGRERLALWRECIPYEEESLRKAAIVFTMSDHVSRSLVEQYGVPQERVLRVNGGINSPAPRHCDSGRYTSGKIVFVGVRWELKGGPQLVEAFSEVRKRHPNASLTIVGCSPNISGPGIQVVGRVSQEEVSRYLAEACCFCMVSRREAFGIAYIEAMYAGLPVVASDLGAAPDFIINGVTGYRVDPNDAGELADRLDELLSAPEKCRAMGQRAQALVRSEYTWARTQEKMLAAISEVVGLR